MRLYETGQGLDCLLLLQRSGRGKGQGEVMPTLDMALFDWTDYEDMKPADTWPSSRKKGECETRGTVEVLLQR